MTETASLPVGKLGIIPMRGCEEISQKADAYIREWRGGGNGFLVQASCPRFSSGEGKGVIGQTVRGSDLYIMCDMFNYSLEYEICGHKTRMSPDDHYADLKRIIAAAGGKARRISVIMPMLYEGRQHRRTARESLDCAIMLQELQSVGVTNILTFDAHDPRVQNAVPYCGFENIQPYYQMIKALIKTYPDVEFDSSKTMIVSTDEGGMTRCIYYSTILGLDLGMYYKRRDSSKVENGRNRIEVHEFLGNNVAGKDIIIVDDMISTGDSVIDISEDLKKRGAGRIFIFATFGLFCEGPKRFDNAYNNGTVEKVFTTNLNYREPGLRRRKWYCEVDMSKYIALLINTLNYDDSLSELINPAGRIEKLIEKTKGLSITK